MEDISKRSIIDMARGAIKERVDYEMTRVVENILDPNTSATAARKITITLNLKPDDTRQNIAVRPNPLWLQPTPSLQLSMSPMRNPSLR